jgi:hypothetical protein
MNRRRLVVVIFALATVVAVLPTPSFAVPVFARKYGFDCTMCHSAFPRLNDFGARFRQNGYQLPGRENEERTVLQGPAPFAARVSAGWNVLNYTDVPAAVAVPPTDVNQFQLNSLDLLSAGLFGKNIGYFMVYVPGINASSGVVGQEGTLEMANVVFSNIGTSWFNVRAGRMEPAYVAISAKRRLTFTPYAIYDYAFPGGVALSATQTGVEIYGQARWPGSGFALGYAAGYMNGTGTNEVDSPSDYYGRAYVVIGAGEGQTAGQRIGLVAYQGKATSAQGNRASFTRYGLDASLNVSQWNLSLQYLRGTDGEELWNATKDGTFSGGFVELNWQPMTRLVAFARYDVVNIPDFTDADLNPLDPKGAYPSGITIGARYYLVDQLALHAEYSDRTLDYAGSSLSDANETFYTLSIDFAF